MLKQLTLAMLALGFAPGKALPEALRLQSFLGVGDDDDVPTAVREWADLIEDAPPKFHDRMGGGDNFANLCKTVRIIIAGEDPLAVYMRTGTMIVPRQGFVGAVFVDHVPYSQDVYAYIGTAGEQHPILDMRENFVSTSFFRKQIQHWESKSGPLKLHSKVSEEHAGILAAIEICQFLGV